MEAVAGSFIVRRQDATLFALHALVLATAAQHVHLGSNRVLENRDTTRSPLDTTLTESSETVFARTARSSTLIDELNDDEVPGLHARQRSVADGPQESTVTMTTDRDPGISSYDARCTGAGEDNQECSTGNSTAPSPVIVPSNYRANLSQKSSGASPMRGKVEDNDHAVDGGLRSIPASSSDALLIPDAPVAHDTPDAPEVLIDHIPDDIVARDILDREAPDITDVPIDRNTPYTAVAHATTAAPDDTTAHDTPDATIVHDATVALDISDPPDSSGDPRADVTPDAPIAHDWPDGPVASAAPNVPVDHDAPMTCDAPDDSNVPNYPDPFKSLYVPEIHHRPDVAYSSQPINSPHIFREADDSHVNHATHAPLVPEVNIATENPDTPFVPNASDGPDHLHFLDATNVPIAQNTPGVPVVPATLYISKLFPTSVLFIPHDPKSPDISSDPETPNVSNSPVHSLKTPEIRNVLRSDVQLTTGNGGGFPCVDNELRVNRIITFDFIFPSRMSDFVYVRFWHNLFKNQVADRGGTRRSAISPFSPFEETGVLESENPFLHEEKEILEMENPFLTNALKPKADSPFGVEVRPSKKMVDKISLATVVSVDKQSVSGASNPEAMVLGHQYIRESNSERRLLPTHSRLLIERLKAASRTGNEQGSLRVNRRLF